MDVVRTRASTFYIMFGRIRVFRELTGLRLFDLLQDYGSPPLPAQILIRKLAFHWPERKGIGLLLLSEWLCSGLRPRSRIIIDVARIAFHAMLRSHVSNVNTQRLQLC